MAATRTQIYLPVEMRALLDERACREHKSLAQVVREALELYLAPERPDAEAVLASTYRSMPRIEVPSREEWERD